METQQLENIKTTLEKLFDAWWKEHRDFYLSEIYAQGTDIRSAIDTTMKESIGTGYMMSHWPKEKNKKTDIDPTRRTKTIKVKVDCVCGTSYEVEAIPGDYPCPKCERIFKVFSR